MQTEKLHALVNDITIPACHELKPGQAGTRCYARDLCRIDATTSKSPNLSLPKVRVEALHTRVALSRLLMLQQMAAMHELKPGLAQLDSVAAAVPRPCGTSDPCC